MLDSPMPTYRIRRATTEDVNDVVGLRIHAEEWLRAAGIEQWTVRTTGEEMIRAQIDRGVTFVVTTGAGDTIGSLALDQADPVFWTPDEMQQAALYLYKFVIRSERRGSGLGDLLLDWACERAEAAGAKFLRLDCWKTNTALHRYYEKRGFVHYATRTAEGRKSGALFERPTSLRLVNEPAVALTGTHTGVGGRHDGTLLSVRPPVFDSARPDATR
ncbi:GNAT family N-acetyltransferase, partial [Streptomyces sp. NPDC051173]|uniref:GNAT family N-acetyltransferase n=1 Tax=Streptomyces sp. NPDC051173 TaxID=3155164 RepID=UPI00344B50C7